MIRTSSSPEIRPPAAVDNSSAASRRFVGSRPRSGADLGPRLPLVSMPDIGIQLSSSVSEAERGALCAAILSALAEPDADVRTVDFEGTCRVGMWLRAPRTTEDVAARDRGIRHLRLLARGETFAMFVSSSLVSRRFNEAFAKGPRRLAADGTPSPEGPIHLTGAWLTWRAPNRVVTHVRGFDENPWPEAAFEVATTDILDASSGELCCTSERGTPDLHAGAGASALAIFPGQLLLPDVPNLGPAKVLLWYSRCEVNDGGLVAGGEHWLISRTPAARVAGPDQIAVDRRRASVTRRYSVVFEELREPVQYAWTADGFVGSPTEASTSITFEVGPLLEGHAIRESVAVKAVDADGLTAEASLEVELYLEIYSTVR